MLQVKNLAYFVRTARGRRTDFRISNVNFELEQGYFMCLLGKNGSGKSTLFRLLYGLKKPDEGTVTWKGREFGSAREIEKADFRQEIAYVGEEELFFGREALWKTWIISAIFTQDFHVNFFMSF
ncbi:MAG: ATP-binding cassette domain-containing protein [Roseburia sp.]|nr:ATP-binding cassette domain-containing protein [Roseburia sp.]